MATSNVRGCFHGNCRVMFRDCGCTCETCFANNNTCSLDLQHRIEELQSQLIRSHAHISNMEHEYINNREVVDYEIMKLRDELVKLRDRYERLLESHKRLQKVNHSLEEKLLKVVTRTEGEKTDIQKMVASLTSKLVEAKSYICELEEETERYRSDCNLAVQLLHCKPSNFVSHRLASLPPDLQDRLKSQMSSEQIINMDTEPGKETTKLIRVPMQTFPPTAMFYSVPAAKNGTEKDSQSVNNSEEVPMSLIAKVLTQPESKRKPWRTYICTKCHEDYSFMDKAVQTQVFTVPVIELMKGGNNAFMKIHKPTLMRSPSTETEL